MSALPTFGTSKACLEDFGPELKMMPGEADVLPEQNLAIIPEAATRGAAWKLL